MSTKAQLSVPPVHEFDDLGRHRIVLANNEGLHDTSDWYPQSEIIDYKGFIAVALGNTQVPAGLWKLRPVEYRIL